MRQNSSSRRGRGRSNGRRGNQNNANRVYDSNGPDVKVRGTASHVYEKYQTLARDASSAGDRIAAEAYYQHAEHYYRLLMAQQQQEEQRRAEMEARRAPRFNGDGEDAEGDQSGEQPAPRRRNGGAEEAEAEAPRQRRARSDNAESSGEPQAAPLGGDGGEEGEGQRSRKIMSPAELVQESQRLNEDEAPAKPRRPRTRRPRAAEAEAAGDEQPSGESEQAPA